MNERLLGADHKVLKRFFSLDHQTYQEGALDVMTKELLGLVPPWYCDVTIVLNTISDNVTKLG